MVMTQLLKQAIPPVSFANAQIKQLPETEQDRIALLILLIKNIKYILL